MGVRHAYLWKLGKYAKSCGLLDPVAEFPSEAARAANEVSLLGHTLALLPSDSVAKASIGQLYFASHSSDSVAKVSSGRPYSYLIAATLSLKSQAAICISRLIPRTLSLKSQAPKRLQATVLALVLFMDLLLCYNCPRSQKVFTGLCFCECVVHVSFLLFCVVALACTAMCAARSRQQSSARAGPVSHRCKTCQTAAEVWVQQKGNLTLWTGNSNATNSPLGKATWCSKHDNKASQLCMSCVVLHVALQPAMSIARNNVLRPSGGKRRARGSTGPGQSHTPRPCQRSPRRALCH